MLKKRSLVVGLVALAAALLSACAATGLARTDEDEQRLEETPVYDESIPLDENGQPITPNGRLEAIGKANPGFGGLVVDSADGSVTVLMTDIEDRNQAERAAEEAVAGGIIGPGGLAGPVMIARADYAYSDLAKWYRKVKSHVWTAYVGIVTSSGISTQNNRIEISINDLSVKDQIQQILVEQGVPIDAVEIEYGGGWDFLSKDR